MCRDEAFISLNHSSLSPALAPPLLPLTMTREAKRKKTIIGAWQRKEWERKA